MVSVTRKACLLGEFSVGKASIARRYVTGTFTPDYHATLGVNIYKFADAWTSDEGQDIEANLLIWDIEGGELAPGLQESYITGATGALVVGDISRAITLDAMAGHAQMFASEAPGRPLAFALNKADLDAAPETDDHVYAEDITFEYAPEAEKTEFVADRRAIRQIASNLLSNAAKFSPSAATDRIQLTTSADSLTITVTDSGPYSSLVRVASAKNSVRKQRTI